LEGVIGNMNEIEEKKVGPFMKHKQKGEGAQGLPFIFVLISKSSRGIVRMF
jgi:hypothetical protein